MHMCTYAQIYVYMYIRIFICVCIRVYVYIYIYIGVYTHLYRQTYTISCRSCQIQHHKRRPPCGGWREEKSTRCGVHAKATCCSFVPRHEPLKSQLAPFVRQNKIEGEKEVSIHEIQKGFEFVPGLFGMVLRGRYLYGAWPCTILILIEFNFIVPEL